MGPGFSFKLFIYSICFTTVWSAGLTPRPALFSKLNLCNLVFQRTFCVMHMSPHVVKRTKKNSKWATSFWVSTSFWESLPIADQQTFFFIFLHEPYMSLSYTWWKSYFFHHFPMFLIVFEHTNACIAWYSHGHLFHAPLCAIILGATWCHHP